MKLYKLFGGSNTKIFNNTTHTAKDAMPTVYIVSHKFSFMDILIAFEIFAQCGNNENQRVIGGVCDVSEWFQIALTTIFNWVCPTMHLISYNKRCGNTTKEMTKHLYFGDDIIIWQHPYNKSRGLYYILEQCIREYNMTPRVVYIDISDKMTATTVNNESPINIFRKVRNKRYCVTSREIEYKLDRGTSYDIYEQFTKPFWDQALLDKNQSENDKKE
jgi:hypothetical protein